MSASSEILPDPLQSFEGLHGVLAVVLQELDALHADYRDRRAAGRILPNVFEAARIELTYHSNAIEGNTLSLRETQLVIEGLAPGGDRPLREIYEARNHDRALRLIEKWASERPDAPIEEADILDVHAQVLADIEPGAAGRFRTERVLIAGTGFVPPASHKFDAVIPAMITLANRPGMHPVLQAAELHYNLVAIHPFSDGNGRTARLMMNLHLLRHGFPTAVIRVTERSAYLAGLDEANKGRTEPFARFIAASLRRSIEHLISS
jgi:Fic family protein